MNVQETKAKMFLKKELPKNRDGQGISRNRNRIRKLEDKPRETKSNEGIYSKYLKQYGDRQRWKSMLENYIQECMAHS